MAKNHLGAHCAREARTGWVPACPNGMKSTKAAHHAAVMKSSLAKGPRTAVQQQLQRACARS